MAISFYVIGGAALFALYANQTLRSGRLFLATINGNTAHGMCRLFRLLFFCTSSPVRILRDKVTLRHPQISNLLPCGEGAGYAGGIVSAAMDGMACANAV